MKRWFAALAALLLTGWVSVLAAPVAQAASGDVFENFDVVANLDQQGYLQVTETVTLRFGSASGRHGLERTLFTREADDDSHDVIYKIDQIKVSSPDPVSTALTVTDEGSGRTTYVRIRVGSADRVITAPTASYVLKYRVLGLMRSSSDYDELYWDVTGSSMPRIASATASVTVPGGAQGVFCSAAAPGANQPCDQATVSGDAAKFAATDIATGELLTVSVKVPSGQVANNQPILVENAEAASTRSTAWALGGSTAAALVVPFLGWWYLRRRTADYRYAGMPPGTFPPRGQEVEEVRSDPKLEIPVSFAPPRLGVAEAGLLIDGETQVRDTTATLVGLAVAGAVQLRSDDDAQRVRLVDASRAPDAISADLLASLFGGGARPGTEVDLGEPGTLTEAHERVGAQALAVSRAERWFVREPGSTTPMGFNLVGMLAPLAIFGLVVSNALLPLLLLLLPLGISVGATALWVRNKLVRGQRSGAGRAYTDQIEGFRTYLATAEAEQLKFEEGEDIFSKYLPWAIMFDLTDRWTRVCQRLVDLGRIPDVAPYWYYGNTWDLRYVGWQLNNLDHAVGSAIASPPPAISDTGFGSGGSAFGGGGGFSGGGGGGGGGGSW